MFEFLPGADASKLQPVKQTPMVEALAAQKTAEAEAKQLKDNTTIQDGIGAAAAKGTIGFVDRFINDLGYAPKPGFVPTADDHKRWDRLQISPEQRELFAKAVSPEHLQYLEGVAMVNQDADRDLAQFGVLGNIGLSLTDPGMVALDAVAAPVAYSAQAGRIANALRSGLVAAGEAAASQAAFAQYDPEVTLSDIAKASATSFAFAGALGARVGTKVDGTVSPSKVEAALKDTYNPNDSMGAAKVANLPQDPTPGANPLRNETSSEQAFRDQAYTNASITPAFASVRRDLAARMGKSNSPLIREAGRALFRDGVGYTDRNAAVGEATTEFSKRHTASLEAEYRAGLNSAWSDYRKANGVRVWDYAKRAEFYEEVGRAVRGVADVSPEATKAATAVRSTMKRALQLAKDAGLEGFDNVADNPNYLPRYFSAKGFQRMFGEMGLNENQVIEEVIKPAMRKRWQEQLPPRDESKIAAIQDAYRGASAAAKEAKGKYDEMNLRHTEAQKAVDAADAFLRENQGLTGRQLRSAQKKLRDAEAKLQRAREARDAAGAKHADALKREDESGFALKEAKKVTEMDQVDEELLSAVAKAYLKRAQSHFEGDQMALGVRPLDMDSVEEIADLLKDAGVDPVKSEGILARLQNQAKDAGKIDRAKRRIDLDESFTTTLTNEAGEEVQVGMADLFDNDVESVMARYVREVTGWSAMSNKLGIKNRAQLDRFRNQLRVDAKKAGDDLRDVDRMLDIGINATFGKSTEVKPGSKASAYARVLRNWNFARVMNQVGFSLFAELGPTIAHAGLRNFIKSTAFAKNLLIRGADGQLVDKEARVLEKLFAPGTEWMRNPPLMRLEDDGFVAPALGNSRFGRGVDNVTATASHITSVMSGMAPVNTMLQRIAGHATFLRMLELANAKKIGKAMTERLRTWGMSEADQKLVFGALKGKKRISDVDFDALPFDTRERMSAFMHRVSRHQVLEGDVSDSLELMHSVTGKLLMQFRTFMVNSYTRHFLNSIHHYNDWRTYAMVSLSTAAAGMGWAARTYINTIGDPEGRKKQLTEANFYKNAIAQSSWSTVIPSVTDMVWSDFLRNDPVFQNNRSTGLQNGVMGIPTVDLAAKVYGAGGMLGAALKDDEHITEKQMRDFWRIIFFNNMTGVRNLAERAIEDNFPTNADGTDSRK